MRQVHEALSARRDLAYTTIMTVLQRLAKKNLVVQHRDDRAHRYAPMHGRDELVAGLMVDALDQAADSGSREAALVHFVERVGADEAAALRRALAELESKRTRIPPSRRLASGHRLRDTYSVSALAFTIVALLLSGPVPAMLARASWPIARTARRHRAVAGHRAGRRALRILRGDRHREQAVRARSRRPTHRDHHQ